MIRTVFASICVTVALTIVFGSSALAYDWTGELLNDNATPSNSDLIVDEQGKLVVYGTEGSWNNNGHTKEQIFDGNTTVSSNYFDPPGTAAQAGGCWAGIGFTRPKIVTAIRVNCRSGRRHRLHGCLIQGATHADFSDAETIHVITDDANFGTQQAQLVLQRVTNPVSGAFKAFTYFRIIGPVSYTSGDVPGTMCGNCTELEFLGYDAENLPADGEAGQLPTVKCVDRFNGFVNVLLTEAQPGTTFLLQSKMAGETWESAAALYFTQTNSDYSLLRVADATKDAVIYRLRAATPVGASEWIEWTLPYRVWNLGAYIGTTSSYSAGRDGTHSFDGDMESFVDVAKADAETNNAWFGQDFGESRHITAIRYVWRRNNSNGLGGEGTVKDGYFQTAEDSEFMVNVQTIHTIAAKPPERTVVTVVLDNPVATRYIRYHAPDGSYGSIAEIEFCSMVTAVPTALAVEKAAGGYKLTWSAAAISDVRVDGYKVYRREHGTVEWVPVATLETSTTEFIDTQVRSGRVYHYAVSCTAGEQEGERSHTVLAGDIRQLERDSSDKTKLRPGVSVIYKGYPYNAMAHPRFAFDGNTDTCCDLADNVDWASGKGVALGVDLRCPRVVTSARACTRNSTNADIWGRLTGAVVCGSNDDENWSTNYDVISEPFTANGQMQWSEVIGTSSIAYRYVFVKNPDDSINFWGNVSELELFGYTEVGGFVLIIR